MKKIWLTMAGSLLFAFGAMAQERNDTTRATNPSTDYQQGSGMQGDTETTEGRSGTQRQYSSDWADDDRVGISREDLPSGLLETLESGEYSGWENATIYRNKTTDDYMLIIQGNGSPKTFYFDKEGQSLNNTSDVSSPRGSEDNVSQPSSTNMTNEDQHNEVDQSNEDRSRTEVSGESSEDTNSGNSTDDTSSNNSQADVELQTTGPAPSTSWKTEDRVVIVADEIPASLRVTLEDDKYSGWQNSTLYRNRATGEYMIEVRDGSNTKVFFFDKDGKVLSNIGNDD